MANVTNTAVGKKEFERLYQGGTVERISSNDYAFINNEENLYILFDVSNNDKVKENSHTNLSEDQIGKISSEVWDFIQSEMDRAYWEDEPMDAFEEYNTFY